MAPMATIGKQPWAESTCRAIARKMRWCELISGGEETLLEPRYQIRKTKSPLDVGQWSKRMNVNTTVTVAIKWAEHYVLFLENTVNLCAFQCLWLCKRIVLLNTQTLVHEIVFSVPYLDLRFSRMLPGFLQLAPPVAVLPLQTATRKVDARLFNGRCYCDWRNSYVWFVS